MHEKRLQRKLESARLNKAQFQKLAFTAMLDYTIVSDEYRKVIMACLCAQTGLNETQLTPLLTKFKEAAASLIDEQYTSYAEGRN